MTAVARALTHTNFCASCDEVLYSPIKAVFRANRPVCLICAAREGLLPEIVLTTAGDGAEREYQRRRRLDEARQGDRWGELLPLVRLFSDGQKHSTKVWLKGSAGERVVGKKLDQIADIVSLHDLPWPTKDRANLDHVVVTKNGIWVIDSKNYTRVKGGANPWKEERRRIGKATFGVNSQLRDVRSALGPYLPGVPIGGIVCLTGSMRRWQVGATLDRGVFVTRPRHLRQILTRRGNVDVLVVAKVAQFLLLPAQKRSSAIEHQAKYLANLDTESSAL